MEKILVIGKDGMLGSELYERLVNSGKYEVYETTLETLDICSREAVINKVKEIMPKYVINCAAYTNVDACEKNIELARNVNGVAVENIAKAVKEVDACLIHISTDYVFDGSLDVDKEYTEDMEVGPVSSYGRSKLLGEENAKKAEKYYILRTAWLYGHNGKNFLKTMVKLSEGRDVVTVVCDQHGSPTTTTSLCEIIEQVLEKKPEYGIYHSTNEGFTTWAEFTKMIYDALGIKTEVKFITSEEYKNMFPESSDRPKNSKLSKEKLHKVGIYPKTIKESLKDYLKGGI